MEFLSKLRIKLLYPTLKLRNYIRSHNIVKIDVLRRGTWYDADTIMLHALFQVLVNHVENELAYMEVLRNEYSNWIRFKVRWLPRRFRKNLSRVLGTTYLTRNYVPSLAEPARRIKELYTWYTEELPMMRSPYDITPDPEYHFIDADGNPTKEMFSRNTKEYLELNKFHPEYLEFLQETSDIEQRQRAIIGGKLRELLEVREFLWV